MKNTKITVTIGIPAYNEERNITSLLKSLLAQRDDSYFLKKIIVCSDGSSDKTVVTAGKLENPVISIIENKVRAGQAEAQNRIIDKTDTEILVLLNADIVISDDLFIEKLILPISKKEADLTSARVQEIPPRTFIQKILDISMKFKKEVYEVYKSGNNLYTCHGRARAFSKRLYQKIVFKHSIAEDAYSFLFCKYHQFKYKYIKNTQVYYRLPASFSDHAKQSIRFYQSRNLLNKEFEAKFVSSEYYLPKKLLFISFGKYILEEPLILIYLIMAPVLKIKSYFTKQYKDLWDISLSSKNIRSI